MLLFHQFPRSKNWLFIPVIHLPAWPASQTHKFPKGCTNLVPHVSIWMQKITTTTIAYVFSSLDMASDRIRQYRTAYFANIHIRIIRTFFHIKQKNLTVTLPNWVPVQEVSIRSSPWSTTQLLRILPLIVGLLNDWLKYATIKDMILRSWVVDDGELRIDTFRTGTWFGNATVRSYNPSKGG